MSRPAHEHAGQFKNRKGAVILVDDAAGNVIETHEHAGEFERAANGLAILPPFKGYFPLWRQK
jgi:hypothetical protein